MHGPRRIGRRRRRLVALVVAGASLGLACSTAPPEERIRRRLDRAERAAEDGDLEAVMALVSPSYSDDRGRDRRALAALLRYRLGGHGTIHVLKKVRRVDVDRDGRGHVEAWIAVAGSPLDGEWNLDAVDADVVSVNLELEESSGEWLVLRASWRRVRPTDLLRELGG